MPVLVAYEARESGSAKCDRRIKLVVGVRQEATEPWQFYFGQCQVEVFVDCQMVGELT